VPISCWNAVIVRAFSKYAWLHKALCISLIVFFFLMELSKIYVEEDVC